MIRREFLKRAAATGAVVTLPGFGQGALAQGARPGTTSMIIGFPPGGSVDVIARLIADQLKGSYAQTIIVDNRPGAGGRLSLDVVKASAPDGSSMVITPAGMMTIFPHIYKKLGYDPITDFTPVTTVASYPFLLSVGSVVPASVTTVADFVAWSRANPKLASFGSPGSGSLPHFLGATFARAAKFEFVHVAYKGSQPAMQDMLGGHLAANVGLLGNALPYVQDGKFRALAISSPQRSALLPDVPTFRELGMAEAEAVEWFGMFVAKGTPAETVKALGDATRRVLATPEFRAGLAKFAMDPGGMSPEELARTLKSEHERWGGIVKASGFQPVD